MAANETQTTAVLSMFSVQTNSQSEDHSLNIVWMKDADIQINAVFDGHGGSRAVE